MGKLGHHFGSFNNQFYRKSIECMQEVTGGTKPSRWCAGCHDHALLFSGFRPDGWKRTVIFKAEGFEKGMDFLMANPLTVTPLP